ncbi:GNAT family N-acetyltransferase [Actinocrinis puniceicyclus]|uniref:GNAT family N-acetyltransferase n=1 Tax=Actinocrinis puniceicyclus TaxID=977794 RepID=A0A8J7WLW5_9ACTN|nr:GNAT family N-acetyltransferase [Actinocrinis puniceicyclus]MBS2962189.1 GNAT family N-acetyltransferase [Actinocrinis puniceicyclus]
MTLEFAVDPELTETLRAQILACWTEVSNAGGAVGFVPPVTTEDVRPDAERLYAAVESGQDRLIIGRETGAAAAGAADGGRLAAVATLSGHLFRLTDHWRTVKRVMVHPDFQGRGYGLSLMAEVERVARAMGLEMITLDLRGGTGNDAFYKKCGYVEFGRLPGALRLSADDYRDRIYMVLPLRE